MKSDQRREVWVIGRRGFADFLAYIAKDDGEAEQKKAELERKGSTVEIRPAAK